MMNRSKSSEGDFVTVTVAEKSTLLTDIGTRLDSGEGFVVATIKPMKNIFQLRFLERQTKPLRTLL